jgi:hypothetical protein
MAKRKISRDEAIEHLWRKGILTWKLDSCQRQLYDTFKYSNSRRVVWSCSRRLGKSWTLLIIAIETALQVPDAQIKYAAPTAKMVRKIIQPTLKEIWKDCPADLIPKFDRHEGAYTFLNGSKLFIEGLSDGNAENLRGTSMDLGIIDEGAFVSDLKYVVNSILLPQTATTGGRILMASTPPKSPQHSWIDYMREAQLDGAFIKKTIWDWYKDTREDQPHHKDRMSKETITELCLSSGGKHTTDWRREYLVEVILDEEDAILPEFNNELKEEITKEQELPPFYDSYVSMDIGFTDYHAVLFAYLDFKRSKLVISDEILVQGKATNTHILAKLIQQKEKELWHDPMTDEAIPPYMRVADDDMITLNDMNQIHHLTFIPTKKDNKEAAINDARIRLASGQIEINPRCKNLLLQLETGIYQRTRDGVVKKSFARSAGLGHFDLIDAFIYLIRNVQWNKNPYPANYGLDGVFISPKREEPISKTSQALKGLFTFKKR